MDLPSGEYQVKALATDVSPRAVFETRIDRPRDIFVRHGSKTGEDVGLALALPSTILLPVVTIGTIFACWPSESPNRDAWCAKGIGGLSILGLTATTVTGWVLYNQSHTKFTSQPTTTNAPIFSASSHEGTFGWSFSF